MALQYVGIDPGTEDDHCQAIFMDEDHSRLVMVAKTITDPEVIAEITRHTPIGDDETAVYLEKQMIPIIQEAISGTYEPERQGPGSHPAVR